MACDDDKTYMNQKTAANADQSHTMNIPSDVECKLQCREVGVKTATPVTYEFKGDEKNHAGSFTTGSGETVTIDPSTCQPANMTDTPTTMTDSDGYADGIPSGVQFYYTGSLDNVVEMVVAGSSDTKSADFTTIYPNNNKGTFKMPCRSSFPKFSTPSGNTLRLSVENDSADNTQTNSQHAAAPDVIAEVGVSDTSPTFRKATQAEYNNQSVCPVGQGQGQKYRQLHDTTKPDVWKYPRFT